MKRTIIGSEAYEEPASKASKFLSRRLAREEHVQDDYPQVTYGDGVEQSLIGGRRERNR